MKRWIMAIVTVVAISGLGVATASANGYGGCYSGYGYRSQGNYSGHARYSAGYGSRWHDTSHYDYHPGSFQRHRNHYHFVPGHYDYHRSGHFH